MSGNFWSHKKNLYFIEPVTAIFIGALLIAMALPRLAASIAATPGDPVANAIQMGYTVKADKLKTLENSRRLMAKWTTDGRAQTDLGLAQIWRAYHLGYKSPDGKKELLKAINSIKKGLALAPANAYAWLRLSHALYIQNGLATKDVVSAMRMSLLTGPYEARALIPRLILAFEIWPDIATGEKEILSQNIILAVHSAPRNLAKVALKNGDSEWIIRKTLESGHPEELKRFDNFYYSAPLP